MAKYRLCALQYGYTIISIQNNKVQTVCTEVWIAVLYHCYFIISIQNAKFRLCALQYGLQLYSIVILLLVVFRIPSYRMCALQYGM